MCAELGRQGLPLLGEHPHMWGAHQHPHHTQALLLQRVEHHQEPVGRHTGMATPAPQHPRCPTPPTRSSQHPRYPFSASPQSAEQGGRPYRGETSTLTTVLSGRESWLGRVSSWGEKRLELGCPHPSPRSPLGGQAGLCSPGAQGPLPQHGPMSWGAGAMGRGLLTMLRKRAAGSWW